MIRHGIRAWGNTRWKTAAVSQRTKGTPLTLGRETALPTWAAPSGKRQQGIWEKDQRFQIHLELVLNIHWKDWCWSWNSNILATWCEELTHWKRPWCWDRLKAGGEGDNRGRDGWMASPTRWTWVWASSGRWWRTGKPGALQSMGSQSQTRLRDWTELNWGLNAVSPLTGIWPWTSVSIPLKWSRYTHGREFAHVKWNNRC